MQNETIIMFAIGAAFLVLGFLLSFKRGAAEWGLAHGRARIWVKLLGQARAVRVTRIVFGPLVMLIGVFILLMSLVAPQPSSPVASNVTASSPTPAASTGH